MGHIWQLQEASNRFSAVVEAALKDGPQVITRRGGDEKNSVPVVCTPCPCVFVRGTSLLGTGVCAGTGFRQA